MDTICAYVPLIPPNPPLKKRRKEGGFPLERGEQGISLFFKGDQGGLTTSRCLLC
ncbi:hypothetical protein KSU1_D0905 [Candidatus Jettenia caeni]|uniref:Uncharacterized protein n=1 Tax=Candidatus Jettenia caeni TaxID=247490 RepID=I3IR69_9BACT|nr:hypothetical protein KSU1_D0905 [Candidatus Jettenia caeni]